MHVSINISSRVSPLSLSVNFLREVCHEAVTSYVAKLRYFFEHAFSPRSAFREFSVGIFPGLRIIQNSPFSSNVTRINRGNRDVPREIKRALGERSSSEYGRNLSCIILAHSSTSLLPPPDISPLSNCIRAL